ncbi:MAG TPA: AmmeMemoRadiSam system protein B [Anaerolineae bacterium]|nr:AmmeMemoRadiSam system protein B [Anaerolineae bacterium]
MSASGRWSVRRPVIAGSWYPGTEPTLAHTVDEYLEAVARRPVPGVLLGLIAPHAGYAYSGQTAAHAYRQLAGRPVETVVLLGPSHRAWVGDFATSAEQAYATPLGQVALDEDFIAALGQRIPLSRIRGDAEHSLEIQLPFLQRELGSFRLVPILMSADEPDVARELAGHLAEVALARGAGEAGRVLFVASSDLHHIEDEEQVVVRDEAVREALAALDVEALTARLMAPQSSVCGRIPILTVVHAARALGADAVRILHHTNSSEVSGEHRRGQYTVGYMAAAIYQEARAT